MTRHSPNGEPAPPSVPPSVPQPVIVNKEAPPARGLLLLEGRMQRSIQRIFSAALDLIYPRQCAACGRVGEGWCALCSEQLSHVPVVSHQTKLDDLVILSSGKHSGMLQDAVHALKYDHVPALAVPLAQRLAHLTTALNDHADVIVPVPLHENRKRERGYNQAGLLAQALSAATGIPSAVDGVRRVRFTRSQVGLDAQQRRENVAGAFIADAETVRGQTILLVDDVLTTGATLHACASALIAAGAAAVYAVTVTAA